MQQPNIIARAFEMARDGTYRNATEIRIALVREGYEQVHQHLMSPSVIRQLRKFLKKSAPLIDA